MRKYSTEEIYGCSFPVILAPMAGVTDLPFRILCKEQGADVTVTEMISAKALFYGNRNTLPLMEYGPGEHPVGIQLFGSDPELMADMAAGISDRGFDFIDINMGCPVPKVVNNGEGSALMLDPELAGRIVKEVSARVGLPVTVKFRKGFDDDHVNAVEFARIMEENGAAAVAVHGRTRQEYYSGKADWDIIRRVKEAVDIPVIGNGDLYCADDVIAMREETGCDGAMAARGARGNPWLFRDIRLALSGREAEEAPDRDQIGRMILRHAKLAVDFKGEYTAIREMRKHAAWYTAGIRGSAAFRRELNHTSTYGELEKLVMKSLLKGSLPEGPLPYEKSC